MSKYLLCRPLGGLNDNFSRIYLCLKHCKKYNRILMIDMKYNNGYSINFSDYFNISDEHNIIYDSNKIKEIITGSEFSIYPNEIIDLYNYKMDYDSNWFYQTTSSKIYTDIDLNKNYSEDIVLYNACGGGNGSLEIFKIIQLNKFVLDEFYIRYNQIDKLYTSIHIRNTDYKMDYEKFYENNKHKINDKNIFLATDSKSVLNFFLEKNISFKNFTSLPENDSPIHNRWTQNDKSRVFLDTICDLLLLSLGNEFILPDTYFYGYTRLAYNLFLNKNIVMKLVKLT